MRTLPSFPTVLAELKRAKLLLASSFPTKVLQESKFNADMVIRAELVDMSSALPTFGKSKLVMLSVYSKIDGAYVGSPDMATYLACQGIAPQSNGGSPVASIGFIAKEQRWAGWSHRAMCSFGIGDRLFEADYGTEDTLFTEHGPSVIETLEQAKTAASNFAHYVD